MNLSVWLYRRFVSLYPRSFRREYADDLVLAFSEQRHELGSTRCWLRTMRDLASTVPTQHIEVHMKRQSTQRVSSNVSIVFFALAVGSAMLAMIVGASLYALLMLVVCFVAVAIALLVRRAAKPAIVLEGSRSWKKFLIVGAGLLTLIILAINFAPNNDAELSEVGWSVMMLAFLLSFTLIGVGVVQAATHFSHQANLRRSQKHVG